MSFVLLTYALCFQMFPCRLHYPYTCRVGNAEQKAIESLKDAELVADFRKVAQLMEEERQSILKVVKAA